jgi:hypothetical protein
VLGVRLGQVSYVLKYLHGQYLSGKWSSDQYRGKRIRDYDLSTPSRQREKERKLLVKFLLLDQAHNTFIQKYYTFNGNSV